MSTSAYTENNWQDYPNKTTRISAARLNHMETGIKNNNTGVRALENAVNEIKSDLTDYVKIVEVNVDGQTTISGNTSQDLCFSIPSQSGYKCILGIAGPNTNGNLVTNRPAMIPLEGKIRLHIRNLGSTAITVNSYSCYMIFIRDISGNPTVSSVK